MHVRPLAALLATTAVLAAGCGQAAGGGGSSLQSPPPSQPGTHTISGVFLATTSAHPKGGSPQGGIKIGIFTRPFSTAGPLMADPPSPIATARTDADGAFTIEVPGIAAALLRLGDRRPRVRTRALGAARRDACGSSPAPTARSRSDPQRAGAAIDTTSASAATVAAGSSQRHAVIAPAAAATADMTQTAS